MKHNRLAEVGRVGRFCGIGGILERGGGWGCSNHEPETGVGWQSAGHASAWWHMVGMGSNAWHGQHGTRARAEGASANAGRGARAGTYTSSRGAEDGKAGARG